MKKLTPVLSDQSSTRAKSINFNTFKKPINVLEQEREKNQTDIKNPANPKLLDGGGDKIKIFEGGNYNTFHNGPAAGTVLPLQELLEEQYVDRVYQILLKDKTLQAALNEVRRAAGVSEINFSLIKSIEDLKSTEANIPPEQIIEAVEKA